ncbi:hypothetical protein [Vibrio owensii]|uniref:hypothetical protein n=1 Tax=Vibrio owensii TaxID=696485 RepID=UPI0040695FA7
MMKLELIKIEESGTGSEICDTAELKDRINDILRNANQIYRENSDNTEIIDPNPAMAWRYLQTQVRSLKFPSGTEIDDVVPGYDFLEDTADYYYAHNFLRDYADAL